jgi:hypothetical protein
MKYQSLEKEKEHLFYKYQTCHLTSDDEQKIPDQIKPLVEEFELFLKESYNFLSRFDTTKYSTPKDLAIHIKDIDYCLVFTKQKLLQQQIFLKKNFFSNTLAEW